jgi:hypothetical protein
VLPCHPLRAQRRQQIRPQNDVTSTNRSVLDKPCHSISLGSPVNWKPPPRSVARKGDVHTRNRSLPWGRRPTQSRHTRTAHSGTSETHSNLETRQALAGFDEEQQVSCPVFGKPHIHISPLINLLHTSRRPLLFPGIPKDATKNSQFSNSYLLSCLPASGGLIEFFSRVY